MCPQAATSADREAPQVSPSLESQTNPRPEALLKSAPNWPPAGSSGPRLWGLGAPWQELKCAEPCGGEMEGARECGREGRAGGQAVGLWKGRDGLAEKASLEGSRPRAGPFPSRAAGSAQGTGPDRAQHQRQGEPLGLEHGLPPLLGPRGAAKANSAGLSTVS